MDAGQAAPDIFVSYAHRDRAMAEKLVKGLKEEGWSVWWDDELVGGTRFDRAIGDALTGAKCVIVIWSSAALDSDFVFDEAMSAYRRDVIVPLVIDNAKPPLGFGRIQYIELERPEGPDRLNDAVRRILQQPVKPRPAYAGELLTIIVSPKPIEDLEKSGAAIPTGRLLQWEKDWGSGVACVFTGPDGDLLTDAEARARTNPSHVLTPQDATPAAIYKSSRLNLPILVNYRLRMSP